MQSTTPKYMLKEEERTEPTSQTKEVFLNKKVKVRIRAHIKPRFPILIN